jgi:hypothetical protein
MPPRRTNARRVAPAADTVCAHCHEAVYTDQAPDAIDEELTYSRCSAACQRLVLHHRCRAAAMRAADTDGKVVFECSTCHYKLILDDRPPTWRELLSDALCFRCRMPWFGFLLRHSLYCAVPSVLLAVWPWRVLGTAMKQFVYAANATIFIVEPRQDNITAQLFQLSRQPDAVRCDYANTSSVLHILYGLTAASFLAIIFYTAWLLLVCMQRCCRPVGRRSFTRIKETKEL